MILDIAGLKVEWPKSKIPEGSGIGDEIIIQTMTCEQAKMKNRALAQAILDDILID